jgi:hypothetical protein
MSHIEARGIGLSMKSDWVFILEDDAIIIKGEEFTEAIAGAVNYFDCNQPIAITFFAGQFGVFKRIHKNSKYLKVLKVPDYSVATLYSRKALEVSYQTSKQQLGYLPDWPPVLKRKLQWVAIEGLHIDHPAIDDPQSPSHVRHERLNRQGQKNIDVNRVKDIFRYLMFLIIKPFSHPFASSASGFHLSHFRFAFVLSGTFTEKQPDGHLQVKRRTKLVGEVPLIAIGNFLGHVANKCKCRRVRGHLSAVIELQRFAMSER